MAKQDEKTKKHNGENCETETKKNDSNMQV